MTLSALRPPDFYKIQYFDRYQNILNTANSADSD